LIWHSSVPEILRGRLSVTGPAYAGRQASDP
jgi:hypothetical protein